MALAPPSAGFQPLPPLPTIKLGPSGVVSPVGGLLQALGPCGSLQELSCEAGSFSCCLLNRHGCFQSEVLGFISPSWSPGLRSLFRSPTIPSSLSMHECGAAGSTSCCSSTIRHLAGSASRHGAVSPLCPGCPSPPLLLVWVNVSSLSPCLSNFHEVRFSVSSGCFSFLNCCCPSFGCVRRHSVSTYASILAGSPLSLR